MNVSWYLGRRLSLSTDGRRSSPALKVSVAAVALSIAVMLASIAIVSGFKKEIRDKITGFNSHISLYTKSTSDAPEEGVVNLTPTLAKILDEEEYITDYTLQLSVPAIFKTQDDFKGIYLRSLDGKAAREFVRRNIEEGKMPDYSAEDQQQKIVISCNAARQLGLKVGDKVDTYFLTNDVRVRRLEVAAIYNSHFDAYDDVITFGALPLVQAMADLKSGQGTSIQIQTDDFSRTDEYTLRLRDRLVQATADGELFRNYAIDNALNQGAAYFNWLSLLDTNVAVVLVLMTIVAIATLISGMLILILDKQRVIGITRALGAPLRAVRHIFVYLALKVALIGMLIGNVLMLAFLWAQAKWHFLPLDPDSYYIDYVPVELPLESILILNAACILIIYLSLIIPSRYVARISPAEAMRVD